MTLFETCKRAKRVTVLVPSPLQSRVFVLGIAIPTGGTDWGTAGLHCGVVDWRAVPLVPDRREMPAGRL